MKLYCLIAFWACSAGIFVRMCYILNNDYPRVVTYRSAAEDLMWLIFSLIVFAWLGSLLWGWL